MKFTKILALAAIFNLSAFAAKEKYEIKNSKDIAKEWNNKSNRLYFFDANNAETRSKNGIVPGAILLESSKNYDTKVLPTDKKAKLVFYCANTKCTASDQAANRAVKAGFTQVAVMRDGITGWKEAGMETVPAATN